MPLADVSPELAWLYFLALWTPILVAGAVTALKGQWGLFVAGILVVGMVWVIASFRLARPGSWWARRYYDERKLARALERYGDPR